MKLRISFILSLLMLFSTGIPVFGCVNDPVTVEESVSRLRADGLTAKDFYRRFVTHRDRAYWEKKRADFSTPDNIGSVAFGPNSLAVALIHLGEIREAIRLLEDRERERPGEYFTAANLGTAYELNGENQKALDWIEKGIRRNPSAHDGTEWLHVKILEAKLAMEKDPDYLKRNSIWGPDFGAGQLPENLPKDHFGQPKTLAEVEKALVYQLHERLEFVKPPESIVAALLADLGKVFEKTRTAEHARPIRELALTYAPPPAEVKNDPPAAETENKRGGAYLFYGLAAAAAAVLVCGMIAFALLRKRK